MASHFVATRLENFPRRRNSLNCLRLVLATCVIVFHAWPLGGFGRGPFIGPSSLGALAVAGFFAISGWLITESRLSLELPAFAWRRALRIYPGYLASLVVVAFFFAPLGSLFGGGQYSVHSGIHYVLVDLNMRMREYSVGGTPVNVPYPHVWNGSLWTLSFEVLCYIAVGLTVTVVGRPWFRPTVTVIWILMTAAELGVGVLRPPDEITEFLSLAPYFFAGATLYVWRAAIPLHWSTAATAAGLIAIVYLLGGAPTLAALPLAYLLLWLGAVLPLHAVGRNNDISYGMYIYAFPVQQILTLLGLARWGAAAYVLASIVLAIPFAFLSWVCVERPAQGFRSLADRFPLVRRGWLVGRRLQF